MKSKTVVPRERASRDVKEAIAYYLGEGAQSAALRFIDELEEAYVHISRHPGTGSMRYAHELNLPGLRFWSLTCFAHMDFYFEQSDCVVVWRVLHGQRDIPAWMQTPEADS